MKATCPLLIAVAALAVSACDKARPRTESQIENAALRQRMAEQKSARKWVEHAAADHFLAVHDAAFQRRGVAIYGRVVSSAERTAFAGSHDSDLAEAKRKMEAAETRLLVTQKLLAEAASNYGRVALPNTPPPPDFQSLIAEHQRQLDAEAAQMEAGDNQAIKRWTALATKELGDLEKEP